MQKKTARIFGILLVIEAILFFGVILTSMTDEMINSAFPFFLDSHEFRISAIFMTILNNLILTYLIYQVLKIFQRKNQGG